MVYMQKRFCITVLSLFLLGCTSHKTTTNNNGQPDPTLGSLNDAASSISQSLASLAESEAAANPSPPFIAQDPQSYGMGATASINWTGPVGPLVEQISKASNYSLRVLGNPPGIPIVVTVHAKNQPLGDILRNVNYQCGQRAHIVVFPNSKVVELRYAKL